MRRTVAKRIAKMARKAGPTEYKIRWFERLLKKTGDDGKPARIKVGTIFCTGYRRVYRDMKRQYKKHNLVLE